MRRIVLGTLLACLTFSVHGEPAPVASYLMQTPLNAFDYGLFRLGQRFEIQDRVYQPMNRPGRMLAVANYDRKRERIVVAATVYVATSAMAADDARAVCRFAIADSRFYGGVDPSTGKRFADGIRSLAMFFESPSGSRTDQPENFEHELLSIVDFNVQVYLSQPRTGKVEKKAECFAPLLGTDVQFIES